MQKIGKKKQTNKKLIIIIFIYTHKKTVFGTKSWHKEEKQTFTDTWTEPTGFSMHLKKRQVSPHLKLVYVLCGEKRSQHCRS